MWDSRFRTGSSSAMDLTIGRNTETFLTLAALDQEDDKEQESA